MASRFRHFIRLQNVFHLKILNRDQVVSLKFPSAHLYGAAAKSKIFSKGALIVGGLSATTVYVIYNIFYVRRGDFDTCDLYDYRVAFSVYGYLAAPTRKDRFIVPITEISDCIIRHEVPDIKPSIEIPGPFTDLELEVTLYQCQNCQFCCKVRAFLDFYGIPYKVIEVNPVMRQQLKFCFFKKVPILIVKDKKTSVKYQLKDSYFIISIICTLLLNTSYKLEDMYKKFKDEKEKKVEVLNTCMYGDKGMKGRTDEDVKKEWEWRKWTDSTLVHILSSNIYRTYDEALQAFNYFSEVGEWEKNFTYSDRLFAIYVGATAMYFISKRLKKRHNLKGDVRQSLFDACNLWLKAVGPNRKFMGGDVPNLADLAVYGVLNSIEGCTAFKELLQNTKIGPWYYDVKKAVTSHVGYKLVH